MERGMRGDSPQPALSPVAIASPDMPPTNESGQPAEAIVARGLAEARAVAGEGPLARMELLDRIARFRSTDMAQRHYFSHVDPDGVTPFEVMRRMGARYGVASEIIAWNTASGDAGPMAAVRGWLASAGHREAMLDGRHHHAGIGVASDGGRRLYTVVFTD